MNTEQKAKEILEYCLDCLSFKNPRERSDFKESIRYKDMLKEIINLLETD